MTQQTNANAAPGGGVLGTFGGVFTPSILTILGLVLFLRVGSTVGSVGLVQALIILAIATSVSVLTSISLAVVATNMRVRGGGEYFLISRTLGIEFGGAVGVVLYLAISVSIAFYAIGFAEAVVVALGRDSALLTQGIAALLVLLLAGVAAIGADLDTRLQYLVMGLLIIALVSFFAGAIGEFNTEIFADNITGGTGEAGFWETFAVFFPAVTGFSQGVAMSGDLREPSKSITRGTFMAVGVSTIVYVGVIVVISGVAPAVRLVADTTTVMGDFSLVAGTTLIGVLAATLSSTLASALGGPRVLQRLGEDRVLPKIEFFEKGAGATNNPRRALGLSTVVALLTVAAGDLNAIAPIISMFFLASYGLINYATYFEIRAGGTSFRPRFKWFDKRLSLLGMAMCGVAILAINPITGLLAALVFVGLFNYLRNRETTARWVDSSGSHHFTQARHHIQSIGSEPASNRDWRPSILAFVPRDPGRRQRMIQMAAWLEGDSGFLTAVRIVEGSGLRMRQANDEIEADLQHEVANLAPGAFARTVMVEDAEIGVQTLVQAHGLGTVKPNTALFGVRDLRGNDEDQQSYGQMLQGAVRFGTNVAVLNVPPHAWERFEQTPRDERTIALWWSDDQVGQFITLLGWLAQQHDEWSKANIKVYVPSTTPDDDSEHVRSVLEAGRIDAEVKQVDGTPASFAEAMGGATMAMAPLRIQRGRAIGPFESPLGMLLESLPLAVMALATEDVDIDAEADDGGYAEYAQAVEQAESAQKWVTELDNEAAMLMVKAESARQELEDLREAEPKADLTSFEAFFEETDDSAHKAYRKYVDARTRHRLLEQRVEELDPDRHIAEADPSIWQSSSAEAAP